MSALIGLCSCAPDRGDDMDYIGQDLEELWVSQRNGLGQQKSAALRSSRHAEKYGRSKSGRNKGHDVWLSDDEVWLSDDDVWQRDDEEGDDENSWSEESMEDRDYDGRRRKLVSFGNYVERIEFRPKTKRTPSKFEKKKNKPSKGKATTVITLKHSTSMRVEPNPFEVKRGRSRAKVQTFDRDRSRSNSFDDEWERPRSATSSARSRSLSIDRGLSRRRARELRPTRANSRGSSRSLSLDRGFRRQRSSSRNKGDRGLYLTRSRSVDSRGLYYYTPQRTSRRKPKY